MYQVWQLDYRQLVGVCFYFMQGDLKKFVLDNGIYQRYSKARKNTYRENLGESFEGETLNAFEVWLSQEYGENWFSLMETCARVGNSSYQRIKRLKCRIYDLFSCGACVFLTLTFNDETLVNTTEAERRKLVNDYLKATKCEFVGNIDFGKENDREHYHAVVGCDKVDYTLWHKNGAVKGEKVALKGKSAVKLARYIDKLALHALKDTTFKNRMLYSKRISVV